MKKVFLVLITLTLLISACTSNLTDNTINGNAIKDEIVIGSILPLTGSAASWGIPSQNAIILAMDDINNAGGVNGKPIKIIFEDSKSSPKDGIAAFNKLTSVNDVNVIIGDIASSVTLAMAPLAEEQSVVLISPGSSNPKIKYSGDYVFRTWPSDSIQAEFLANFVKQDYKKFAILYVNNDYGVGLRNEFKKSFESFGGLVVVEQVYEQDSNDLRTQLTKIKEENFDALFLPGYPASAGIAVKQARELGITQPIFASEVAATSDFIDQAGDNKKGVMFTLPVNTEDKVFVKKYTERFNIAPDVTAAEAYDALMLIIKAMELEGTSSDQIKLGLMKVGKNYPGVSGVITFDEYGEVMKPYTLWVWTEDGKEKY